MPRAIAASGLNHGDLVIEDNVWAQIVRPLGFDAGLRTLDRTINGVCRKLAKLKVEGKIEKIIVNQSNLKQYIPTW